MSQNSETSTTEIPEYLQCEPRTFIVERNHWHDETFDLEFTVIIKCTDDLLHETNNFWSNAKYRLEDNNGDIAAVILKMIGSNVFWWCYEHNSNSIDSKYGVNSIFNDEGWLPDCFEITKLYFENHIRDEDFEVKPVTEESK